MAGKCEPYTLFKRQPQGIYYVRYAGQKTRTAHSIGKTSKSEAMKYALSQLKIRGELEFEALVPYFSGPKQHQAQQYRG